MFNKIYLLSFALALLIYNNFSSFFIIMKYVLFNKYNKDVAWIAGLSRNVNDKSHKIGAATEHVNEYRRVFFFFFFVNGIFLFSYLF